jgi:hypothetical protein
MISNTCHTYIIRKPRKRNATEFKKKKKKDLFDRYQKSDRTFVNAF